MPSQIRVYRLKEFIRVDERGTLDIETSKILMRQLAVATDIHSIENVLIDLRGATVRELNFGDILEIAAELARCLPRFKYKIANIIPDDERIISIAKEVRDTIVLYGYRFEIFTSYEDAIDWLSEVEERG